MADKTFIPLSSLKEQKAKEKAKAPILSFRAVKLSGDFPRLDEMKAAFIVQPSMFRAYTGTRINAATQVYPIQAFLWLSAYVKKVIPGFKTAVCDMGVMDIKNAFAWREYIRFLERERPKIICLTVTTPIYYEAKLAGIIAKQVLGPDVIIAHGGVHASHLYNESLTDSMCDVVVRGEGEKTFGEICQLKPFNEINGIAYRTDERRWMTITVSQIIDRLVNGEVAYDVQLGAVESYEPDIRATMPRKQMRRAELDELPFQDLDLYDFRRYHNPRIIVKSHPFIQFETSRGCPEECSFCSAATDNYRVFSPERSVAEMEYYKRRGIKELRINDDQFLASLKRGKQIGELMNKKGLHFDINFGNGVRADRCDREFLELFKRVGLYQVGAGFESGDQESLDSIKKSLGLQQSIEVMHLFREFKIEVVGFFMIGTPGDTIVSMEKTCKFAQLLMPDYAKVTVCIPFPDTPLYEEYDKMGLMKKPERWDLYNIHKAAGVYTHPNPELTPEVLMWWYRKFYRDFYGNPAYIKREISKSIRDGSFMWKIPTALRTFFPRIFKTSPLDNVKARYSG